MTVMRSDIEISVVYMQYLNMYMINCYNVTLCGIFQNIHECVVVFYRFYTEIVSGIFVRLAQQTSHCG